MSSVQPKVTGTFAKTPLLHVLTSLLEQGSTGTLVIESAGGVRNALVLNHGVPVKMRLAEPAMRLSDVLIDLGWIRRDAALASYDQAAKAGRLHGATLVENGHIDSEVLELALRSQIVKKLQWAAALPGDTAFGFYEGADYLSKWRGGTTPVGPLVAIWALARSRAEPAVVATVVSRVMGHQLRLHQKAFPRSFGFDRTELTLIEVMRAKPQTMDALLRLGLVAPHTLERMVYALTLTRHLDFGRGLTPLGVGAVTEREETLLLPKESLRPSRPVMLSSNLSPADTLRIDAEDGEDVSRLSFSGGQPPTLSALDALQLDPSPKPSAVAASVDTSHGATPAASAAARIMTPVPVGMAARQQATPAHGVERPTERRISSRPPPSTSGKPAVTPATSLADRRAQLEKLAIAAQQLSHFEVLGLPQDATIATTQETYLKLAKSYHPDRLPPEMADLKPLATKVFARMSEAHQILTDPAKRTPYLDQLRTGSSDNEEEKIRKVLRAAGAFQKAEVLLKKRMLAAAELEANRALEDDPDQADYLALYAWIQACKADSEPRLPELCRMLTEAIQRNPANEKNRFYRVQIYKRLGQIDKAVSDCRIIVEKNPHHVDALREIRLWDMRRSPQKQTSPGGNRATGPQRTRSPSDPPSASPPAGKRSDPPPSPGGLLGRWFKR